MRNSVSVMRSFACRPVILAGLLGVLMVGCTESVPTGTVQGKVVLDDAPYTDAAVVFLDPKTGEAGSADIQADGTFRMETPLKLGTYTVYLAPKSGAGDETAEPAPVSIDQAVPEKYWNEATSDITIEVVEGENDVTVPLSK